MDGSRFTLKAVKTPFPSENSLCQVSFSEHFCVQRYYTTLLNYCQIFLSVFYRGVNYLDYLYLVYYNIRHGKTQNY